MRHHSGASASQLRVAFLAGSLTQGGAEKQLVYMARSLRDRGVGVRVYSLTRGEHYEHVLHADGLSPVWIGKSGNPLVRTLNLARALTTFQPHVVQAGHFFTNLHVTLAARLVGAQAIGSLRNDAYFEVTANGRWGRWLLERPPALVANSAAAVDNAKRMGFKCPRVHFVGNVIDLDEFDRAAGSTEDAHEEMMCAAVVCRLVRAKRVDRFLRALARTRRRGCSLRGVIVGDGPERSALESQARSLGLTGDTIRFLGRREDIPAVLRTVDVLVVTSDHEGTPNVILEAMAARRPVLTTAAGDAGRIVRDGVTGFVVPLDNDNALDDRLAQLASSPAIRCRLGEAGRREVTRGYDARALGDRLVAVYEAIATESRNPYLCSVFA